MRRGVSRAHASPWDDLRSNLGHSSWENHPRGDGSALRSALQSFACVVAVCFLVCASTGCGGGTPLLHPARTLATGDLRAAGGVSANIAPGSLGEDLRHAREIAARDPEAPGPPGSNPDYAKGALVSAA